MFLCKLTGSVVAVICLVVHDEFPVDKVKAVGLCGERVHDHLPRGLGIDGGEVVDVLAGVLAVRHAKAEVKVEGLEVWVPEEMTLDHAEVLHGLIPDCELNGGADGAQFQELGGELISEKYIYI